MRFVAALLGAASLTACSVWPFNPIEPLVMPEPVVFPREVEIGKVKGALLNALARRKWVAEADLGYAFVAVLRARGPALRIRLEYSAREVRFVYQDSDDFGYEIDDGVPTIRSRANRWLRALGIEVQRELQFVIFEYERVDVVPAAPGGTPPASATPAPEPGAAADPGLRAGATAVTRRAVRVLGGPMQDAIGVEDLPEGHSVQLVSQVKNLKGTWWYVNTGRKVGWLHESWLRGLTTAPAGKKSPAG